ncbi:hypothetical protein GGQ88_000244 [Novosphingobium hassiacum]|uniref:TIR domain-containing protein n=1 Tax=Novosphingobium hassiacum TaxID=173676 RepID=A0A7W5ZV58_9SPHN|nr:toll/interleukin-1 receptor domain-containing protein [Novosphingobium hassiacum]MBB3859004.1 hypothetical protein [Novosphingobium hassiacum]
MKPRKIFTSYAHRDEQLKSELDQHLTPLLLQGRVELWNDRHIRAGAPLYEAIKDNIRSADIILMLISADYVASPACQEEMTIALERGIAKQALAIPILLRACDWTGIPIGQLLAANRDAKPINSAPDRDVAWFDVVCSIKQILNDWDVESAEDSSNSVVQATEMSDAVADERAIRPPNKGQPGELWVYRKESNEKDWEAVKASVEETLCALAESNEDHEITLQTKRWGEKIIVDFRLPRHRNPRRLLIADISGYAGYPGYQLEIYPRDSNLKLPSERVRWLITGTGERVLKRLDPETDGQFTVAGYAAHIWGAIKSLT